MLNISKKSLMQLPERKKSKSIYDSIILMNSRKKHDSGYAIMYIIGCIKQKPIEIIKGCTDSIDCRFNRDPSLDFGIDMLYPSGLIRFFGINCKFLVGNPVSTTQIKLIKEGKLVCQNLKN